MGSCHVVGLHNRYGAGLIAMKGDNIDGLVQDYGISIANTWRYYSLTLSHQYGFYSQRHYSLTLSHWYGFYSKPHMADEFYCAQHCLSIHSIFPCMSLLCYQFLLLFDLHSCSNCCTLALTTALLEKKLPLTHIPVHLLCRPAEILHVNLMLPILTLCFFSTATSQSEAILENPC